MHMCDDYFKREHKKSLIKWANEREELRNYRLSLLMVFVVINFV